MDVAWNQVKVNGLPREEKQRLLSEVEILKELDHKNIIKLYHSWIVTEKDEISVNFITEACAQTLKKYAAKLKTNLDLRAVKSWSRQILRGLDYLHSHEPPIVHRDLKCDNIFVNQNQGEVKIGDLGLAAALENQRTKSVIGTPEFMAPELYDEDYDERVDIYSFGMCIIELVTHECPYSECSNPAQIYKRVTGGVKPEALDKIIDSDLRSFILKCISPIEKRLTAKELMNDPFLDKSLKPKLVEKPARATVEEEPEAERPGGTAKYAVVNGDKKEREEDDGRPGARSARESAAEGEHNPDADAGAAGDARLGGFSATTGRGTGARRATPRARARRRRSRRRPARRTRARRTAAATRARGRSRRPPRPRAAGRRRRAWTEARRMRRRVPGTARVRRAAMCAKKTRARRSRASGRRFRPHREAATSSPPRLATRRVACRVRRAGSVSPRTPRAGITSRRWRSPRRMPRARSPSRGERAGRWISASRAAFWRIRRCVCG